MPASELTAESSMPDRATSIRVLIVDDHPLILDALGRSLGEDPGIELVGAARSRQEAETAIRSLGPQVVVCDVQMGTEAEGLRLLAEFGGAHGPRFLMLSAYDYPSLFRAAFDRGAAGFLIKTSELAEVVAAVHHVASGGTAFLPIVMRSMRQALRRPSERELDLLELLAGGSTNEEIASALVVSLKTVESHLRRLFDRYGAMNRTELAVLAVREGWVSIDGSDTRALR